jgi:hypothetical protein
METYEFSQGAPPPGQVSVWPTALRHGAIWGAVGILVTLTAFLTDTDPALPSTGAMAKTLWFLIGTGAAVASVVMAILHHRDKELGGFLKLSRAMGMGVAVGLVAGALIGVYGILHVTVINPGWAEQMQAGMMEQMMEQGMADEQAEQTAGMFSFMFNPLFQLFGGLLNGAFMGFLIGLFSGLVLKKEQPSGGVR